MNIDELTLGQVKELSKMLGEEKFNTLNSQLGEKVIIRTYSAGVWFGELEQKAGKEVFLKNARRMYSWKAAKSISLSGVAKYGIVQDESSICPPIERVWLEAIEIITLTNIAIESIEECPDVEAR